jgi:hypothetical protein
VRNHPTSATILTELPNPTSKTTAKPPKSSLVPR